MITYTKDRPPVRAYSPAEILAMSPARLRKELSNLCTREPDTAEKIETLVEFEPRWSKMTAIQYGIIALAWALLESHDAEADNHIQYALWHIVRLNRKMVTE